MKKLKSIVFIVIVTMIIILGFVQTRAEAMIPFCPAGCCEGDQCISFATQCHCPNLIVTTCWEYCQYDSCDVGLLCPT